MTAPCVDATADRRIVSVAIRIGGITIVKNGEAIGASAEQQVKTLMKEPRYVVEMQLGQGPGQARFFMCDLTHEYVNVNADYRY